MTAAARCRRRRLSAALVVLGLLAVVAVLARGAFLAWPGASGADKPTGAAHPVMEVPATATNQSIAPANNSPTLVADPSDPEFVALANRLDAPDFSCGLHVSGDGGRGWAPLNPVPALPVGAEKCYAPEVAFDRRGVLHYLFVGLAGGGNEPMGAFLTTSADRGRTFTPPRQVLGPLNFAVRMAIDPTAGKNGRLHLVWIAVGSDPPLGGFPAPPNPIMSAFSDDGGDTFTHPVQVNDQERLRVVAPTLAVGPNHHVHVAYYDLKEDAIDYQGLEGPVWEGTWSVVLATSTDGGNRYENGVVVDDSVVPPERVMLIFTMTPPALAVHEDRACLAWADARRGDSDVFTRCSDDGGQRWGPARRVNDDPAGNGLSQFMPRLAFSPAGRLDAVFYDRRRHPQNVLNHVYFTSSRDGGRAWEPNVRLTSHASNSRIGQEYANQSAEGLVEFGSRLGLLSRDAEAVAAYADTRNSRPGTTGQDVFTAVVGLPASTGSGGRLRLAGVALVILAGISVMAGGWHFIARRPTSAAS